MASGSEWRGYGRYGTVGLEFFLSIALGFVAGRWADGKLGTHGWLTGFGIVVGIYAGYRAIAKAMKSMREDLERIEASEREEHARYLDRAKNGAPTESPDAAPSPEKPEKTGTTDGGAKN